MNEIRLWNFGEVHPEPRSTLEHREVVPATVTTEVGVPFNLNSYKIFFYDN